MITFNQIFNPYSLNIFTDASMNSYQTIGCPGFVAVYGDVNKKFPLLKTSFKSILVPNHTNNYCEALAINMAIFEIINNRNFYSQIRIFSDSYITINGLNNSILNWRESKRVPGKVVGSQGIIKNQQIFMEILYNILQYRLPVQFFHQKGHVDFDENGLLKAEEVFCRTNGITDRLEPDVVRAICYYNNYVDRQTRTMIYTSDLS